MGRIRAFLYLLCVLSFSGSCCEPSSREFFVKSSAKDAGGRYSFNLDMRDSLSMYSVNFFTRIDNGALECIPNLAVDVLLVSPSGKEYAERVYLPKEAYISDGNFANDCDIPYRTGFRPVEHGVWKMFLTVPDENSVYGFRGMGICLSKDAAARSAAGVRKMR